MEFRSESAQYLESQHNSNKEAKKMLNSNHIGTTGVGS